MVRPLLRGLLAASRLAAPVALAFLPGIAEAKLPLIATAGTQSVIEPPDDDRRRVFKTTQNDDLIADALPGDMLKSRIMAVGLIGFNVPYGENRYKAFAAQAARTGLRKAASEGYARDGRSVTGQTLTRLVATPYAVPVAGVGGGVLSQTTLHGQGCRGVARSKTSAMSSMVKACST